MEKLTQTASQLYKLETATYINTYSHYVKRMPYRSGVTTIQLSPDTRDKLKDLGKKGETYEEIILRLVKAYR